MFSNRRKVFCIGQNKTGTTSLEHALRGLGYTMGDQRRGEMLLESWARRDFSGVIRLCKTAEAFQDIPFSLDFTYVALDSAFRNSKFILTVRDSPEQWYRSLTSFHAKILGVTGIPTAEDVKRYRASDPEYRLWLWRYQTLVFGVDEEHFYDKDICIDHYLSQNKNVTRYFRGREQDLLVLNVTHDDAMERLCRFLGRAYHGETMPHVNKT